MTRLKSFLCAAGLALVATTATAQDKPVFYLLSHGGATDPFWVDWNAGVTAACEQLAVTCNVSFSNGDFAAQKEAFNAAIAAKPAGIATTAAQPGLWVEEVPVAQAAGIPVVFYNTDDKAIPRQAYVGADLGQVGRMWAQYLVDNAGLKKGDKVFMPVEVPGASYQVLETEGIASVFDPLGIEYEVVDAGVDPAGVISVMSDYLTANQPAAIIGLGDLVASSIRPVMEQQGIAAGQIPAVGWGNSNETAEAVRDGYVQAAAWQFPSAQGFMPVALLSLAAKGEPIGYDIITLSLYTKDSVQPILDHYAK
jgi:simple sugar transport system substrate-binding protein